MKTLSVGIVLCLAATTAFAAPRMREGNWEVVVNISMEGRPFNMPPMKYNQCITKDDLKDSKKTLPTGGSNNPKCEVQDVKESGSTTTWKTVCKDGTTATGKITYQGDRYVSTMTTLDKRGGKVTNNMTGKRTGDCKK